MRELEYFDPSKCKYNQTSEDLVKVLMQHCENEDPMFFRMLVSYYFAKVASTMRAEILLHNNTTLPINIYAINLAPSGAGKGKSRTFVCSMIVSRTKPYQWSQSATWLR